MCSPPSRRWRRHMCEVVGVVPRARARPLQGGSSRDATSWNAERQSCCRRAPHDFLIWHVTSSFGSDRRPSMARGGGGPWNPARGKRVAGLGDGDRAADESLRGACCGSQQRASSQPAFPFDQPYYYVPRSYCYCPSLPCFPSTSPTIIMRWRMTFASLPNLAALQGATPSTDDSLPRVAGDCHRRQQVVVSRESVETMSVVGGQWSVVSGEPLVVSR